MDAIDRQILAELQADGRLSITELADRVRLTISPCHRRVRALEESGAISGYRAVLDARALGLSFEALVFVTMKAAEHDAVSAFERSVEAVPAIVHAQRLFGAPDYLLRVVTRDLPDFQQLYDSTLSRLPHVQGISSTLVMKTVSEDRPLPI